MLPSPCRMGCNLHTLIFFEVIFYKWTLLKTNFTSGPFEGALALVDALIKLKDVNGFDAIPTSGPFEGALALVDALIKLKDVNGFDAIPSTSEPTQIEGWQSY
jgi:hypothetical protein